MKVGFVVQRYGSEVIGGAEYLCRQVAEHMAKHWEVEVITTCARLHTTWRNEYSPGEQTANGVVVRRFLADRERDQATFSRLSQRVLLGLPHRLEEEVEWMQAQGPYSTPLLQYLSKHKGSYDAFLFYTYLYCTSYFGLPLVADKALLVPATHDEPMLRLSIFDELFRLPRAHLPDSGGAAVSPPPLWQSGDSPHHHWDRNGRTARLGPRPLPPSLWHLGPFCRVSGSRGGGEGLSQDAGLLPLVP